MTEGEIVEIMARAIASIYGDEIDVAERDAAKAAIEALKSHGLAIATLKPIIEQESLEDHLRACAGISTEPDS